MTKDEFLKLKDDLIMVIIRFEALQRKSNFLKQTYLLELSNEIKDEMKYSFENDLMLNSIKKLTDGIDKELIKKDILASKIELNKKIDNFNKNLEEAAKLSQRCENYTIEDMEKFDNKFAIFCQKYHPILKGKVSDVEQTVYSLLAKLYRDGNIEAFDKVYLECEGKLTNTIIDSNYDSYAYFYNESLINLNALIEKMENSFPLNIEDRFSNYDSITGLIGEKREKVYNLRELNKAIKADFLLHFDVEL